MKLKLILGSVLGLAVAGFMPSAFAHGHYCGCPTTKSWYFFGSHPFFYPQSIVTNAARDGYTVLTDKYGRYMAYLHRCVYKVIAVDNTGTKWKLFYSATTGKLLGKKLI